MGYAMRTRAVARLFILSMCIAAPAPAAKTVRPPLAGMSGFFFQYLSACVKSPVPESFARHCYPACENIFAM